MRHAARNASGDKTAMHAALPIGAPRRQDRSRSGRGEGWRGDSGTAGLSPLRSLQPAVGFLSNRRKACNGRIVSSKARAAGLPGPPYSAPRPHLSLVARCGAALLGLWLSTTVAGDPPGYRIENLAIPESLTGQPGDPARGERIVRDADRATCLICHALPIEGEPDPGNIGPPLHGVAKRYTAGELRLRLVDPKRLNPETVMPSYYARDGFHRVAPEYRGRSIYTASEIEDVIAYLLTLSTD